MEVTRIVTLFADRAKSEEPEYIFHQTALDRIKNGASIALIEQIRATSDKDERTRLKALLPCICFSGRFMKRKNEAQEQHSGFIILDFDDSAEPEQLKRDLFAYPFVKAVWLSPSGTGVKCLVRVPTIITQHRGHFAALEKKFAGIDPSGKDEARICYESYDPGILIRQEPQVYQEYEVPNQPPPRPTIEGKPVQTDYRKLNQSIDMLRKAQPGSRNETLLKAARLVGGFIASGYVPESVAYQALEDEVRSMFSADEVAQELHTIKNGIEYGKVYPIYDQIPEEQPVSKTAGTHSIKFLASCWDTMKQQHKNGKLRGTSTHMPGMDGHFSWKKGEVTLVSGYANAGKSEWVYHLALLKSYVDGSKWAVFGSEAGDATEFYDGLIHSLVGKSVDPAYANQMTLQQYGEAADFIQDHFFFIDPDIEHTIADVEANFEYCINELGCDGVILDPYNALSDRTDQRDDKHLQEFLNKRLRFAKHHNINYVILAHPNGNRKPNKDGEYEPVRYFDMAGGAMWSSKVHNFMVVHRPLQNTEPGNTLVEIIILKIKKQRLVGIPGTVRYSFERGTNRYTWYDPMQQKAVSPFERINSSAPGKPSKRFN